MMWIKNLSPIHQVVFLGVLEREAVQGGAGHDMVDGRLVVADEARNSAHVVLLGVVVGWWLRGFSGLGGNYLKSM